MYLCTLATIAKNILVLLGLIVVSVTNAAIHNKMFGSDMTTWKISNEIINDIMKIANSLKDLVYW